MLFVKYACFDSADGTGWSVGLLPRRVRRVYLTRLVLLLLQDKIERTMLVQCVLRDEFVLCCGVFSSGGKDRGKPAVQAMVRGIGAGSCSWSDEVIAPQCVRKDQ